MTNQHSTVLARIAVRQRREGLLSVVAATTLFASWYLSAALDARDGGYSQASRTLSTAFDAAFVAANGIDERTTLACAEPTCPTQLAQNDSLQAHL